MRVFWALIGLLVVVTGGLVFMRSSEGGGEPLAQSDLGDPGRVSGEARLVAPAVVASDDGAMEAVDDAVARAGDEPVGDEVDVATPRVEDVTLGLDELLVLADGAGESDLERAGASSAATDDVETDSVIAPEATQSDADEQPVVETAAAPDDGESTDVVKEGTVEETVIDADLSSSDETADDEIAVESDDVPIDAPETEEVREEAAPVKAAKPAAIEEREDGTLLLLGLIPLLITFAISYAASR
jgi:hypothetical protein